MNEHYAPPRETRDARPAVIRWYRVYAGTIAVLSLALPTLGAHRLIFGDGSVGGLVVMLAALPVSVLFAVAALVPYRPWGWSLGLFAIALGLFGVTMVFAVPLLVMWFRPTVKAAFARL